MKHSPYPFAPLLPLTVAGRYRIASVKYGVGLGVEANRPGNSEKTERDGDLTMQLAERVDADLRQAEFGPLAAVSA